jgi:hypothetical protein
MCIDRDTLDSNNPMHKLFVSERPTIGHFPAAEGPPETAFSGIFMPDANIIFYLFGFRQGSGVIGRGRLTALDAARPPRTDPRLHNRQEGRRPFQDLVI